MDTPVEPEKAQEDELDEGDAILMDDTPAPPPATPHQPVRAPRKHRKGRTAETVRPITGIYTRFTFCPYDTLPNNGALPYLREVRLKFFI